MLKQNQKEALGQVFYTSTSSRPCVLVGVDRGDIVTAKKEPHSTQALRGYTGITFQKRGCSPLISVTTGLPMPSQRDMAECQNPARDELGCEADDLKAFAIAQSARCTLNPEVHLCCPG